MAKLPNSFSFGSDKNLETEDVLRYLQEMYTQIAVAVNIKPDVIIRDVDGQATDTQLSNGTININSTTNKVEILTEHDSSTTVVWTQLS